MSIRCETFNAPHIKDKHTSNNNTDECIKILKLKTS